MLIQALLRGLVVVRRYRKNPIHADLRKLSSANDDLPRIVAASTGKDGNFPLHNVDRYLDDAQMFFVCKRGAFSGCSARNQKVDSSIDLALDQFL